MTGYVREFEGNSTMSFKISDKQLLKSKVKYGKKLKVYLLSLKFNSEPDYRDNDKYIKAKIKTYGNCVTTKFWGKKCQKKMYHWSVYQ